MNSVSKFLYFAAVSDHLSGIAAFWGILLSLAICVAIAVYIVLGVMASSPNQDDKDASAAFWPYYKGLVKPILLGWFVCGLAYSFMPSKETLYAIAAAQVGEQVIKNQTVQGVTDDAAKALQAWIRRQIDEPKK